MRISVHANGFELTRHTREFAATRVQCALGRFEACIKSVRVHLDAVKGRLQPDTTRCRVMVTLHPSGKVRSLASHAWMNVAIDRACADAGLQMEDEIQRRRTAATTAPVAGDWLRARALDETAVDDSRPSHPRRGIPERSPSIRPGRLRERWKPPGAQDEAEAGDVGSTSRRWSRPLSRVY